MLILRRFLHLLAIILFFFPVTAQYMPFHPISTPFISPFTNNPAVAGSKDHSGINFISVIYKQASSQLISADTRFTKTLPGYVITEETKEFRNLGTGVSLYHQQFSDSRDIGGNLALSYHIPLTKRQLTFLSAGVAVKGISHSRESYSSVDTLAIPPAGEDINLDFDLGVYLYSGSYYMGLSVINFNGNIQDTDSLEADFYSLSRQYFAHAGLKLLLNRRWNIVLEPELILNTSVASIDNLKDKLNPVLKLYLKDFCLGYYIKDKEELSFFFEYRYPNIFLSAYFDLPKNSAFYRNEPSIELAAGIKLGKGKKRAIAHSRW